MSGILIRAIKTHFYRLSKNLNLDDDQDLKMFIMNL